MLRQTRWHGGGLHRPPDLFVERRYSRRRAVVVWLAISIALWLTICALVFAVGILDPSHPVPVAV
jgi:hypothetical protein